MFLKCHRTQEVTKIDFKKGRVLGRGSKRIESGLQDMVYISSKGPKDSQKNVSNNHPNQQHKNLPKITKKITEKQKFQIWGSRGGEQVKHKFDLLIVGLQTTPHRSQSLDGKKLKQRTTMCKTIVAITTGHTATQWL